MILAIQVQPYYAKRFFARLRSRWPQVESADYNGRTLREAFDGVMDFVVPSPPGPAWESDFLEAVYDLLWQFVAEGVIRPGNMSLTFPDMSVAEYGKRVINNETLIPTMLSVS